MKRHLSIVLALFILTESFLPLHDIYELTKLPALLEHFQAHRSEDPDISIFGFLLMHYNNQEHHHNDHTTHHKLPFSDHHKCMHASQTCLLFYAFEMTAISGWWLSHENHWGEIVQILIPSFASFIWQPPKFS